MMPDPRPALWRRVALTVALLATGALFLTVVDHHYAIDQWLAWHYLRCWVWCLAMVAGCVGTGEVLVGALVGRVRGVHAHLMVSFCTGLLVFGLLVFATGMLQLYGDLMFYGLPLGMIAVGHRRLWALYRQLGPRLQRLSPFEVRGVWAVAIIVFGAYAWLMIYAAVLVPDNVMFDSQWKHVAIAESYASHGGIFRYPQGWMFASRPHFASYLYTWAFLLPDSELFDRLVMCGHIEFVVVAFTTLVGIPALVRRLVPDADPKLVWVARFLFPGVFLYDSNLSIGADHIAATFTIPIYLATHDLLRRRFAVRHAVLVGMMSAGILLTKETAAAITIPGAAVVILVGAGIRSWRARDEEGPFLRRHGWIGAGLTIVGVGLAVSSPLWLKNLIWYGDPLYPNLYRYFTPRPWVADAEHFFEWGFVDYQFALWKNPESHTWAKTFEALVTWSFDPHDWKTFHGDRPVIGSLLTMLLPGLLLLRRGTRPLWVLAAWIHIGILAWYRVLPQDRYLQVLMPWMAAWTAAMLILLWRARVRVATAAVVAAQIVWGGDVYFLHRNMLSRLQKLMVASRKEETMETRLHTQKHWREISETIPKGSRLVVHEIHPHLGTGVPTYSDFQTYQFGLSYGLMHSPRELWDAYREMGITHIWWAHQRSKAWNSVAGDIMFFDMALRHSVERKKFGRSWVAALPPQPPEGEDAFEDTVAVVQCRRRQASYGSGLYRVRDMHVPIFKVRDDEGELKPPEYPAPRRPAATKAEALALARSASYIVLDPACRAERKLPPGFRLAAKRRRLSKIQNPGYEIFIRLDGSPEPWPEGEVEITEPDPEPRSRAGRSRPVRPSASAGGSALARDDDDPEPPEPAGEPADGDDDRDEDAAADDGPVLDDID